MTAAVWADQNNQHFHSIMFGIVGIVSHSRSQFSEMVYSGVFLTTTVTHAGRFEWSTAKKVDHLQALITSDTKMRAIAHSHVWLFFTWLDIRYNVDVLKASGFRATLCSALHPMSTRGNSKPSLFLLSYGTSISASRFHFHLCFTSRVTKIRW